MAAREYWRFLNKFIDKHNIDPRGVYRPTDWQAISQKCGTDQHAFLEYKNKAGFFFE